MISKLRFSLIAVTMLVLLGFGFQNQAQGQIGLGDVFCPAVPDTTGWLQTEIVGPGLIVPDFSGGLIGTVEASGGDLVGGLDWQHTDFFSFDTPTPTTQSGAQLVSWWTQKNGRNTYLQVTNGHSDNVTVHVRIHNEACLEIRDFCDTYTPHDTHEYNFGDLFSNGGADIADGNLQGVEGWLVVTAVKDCGNENEKAIDHDDLSGQLIVHDSNDYLYGVNVYARQSICEDGPTTVTKENLIFDGSAQSGFDGLNPLGAWELTQGNGFAITRTDIQPPVSIPPAQEPDSENPDSDLLQFLLVSSDRDGVTSPYYMGGSFQNLADPHLTNLGNNQDVQERNVTVLESNVFVPVTVGNMDSDTVITYAMSYLFPELDNQCGSYTAVLLIDTEANGGDGEIVDGRCYNQFGGGFIATTNGDVDCTNMNRDLNFDYFYPPFQMDDRSEYISTDVLTVEQGVAYVVQMVTGQADPPFTGNTCATSDDNDMGGLFDNWRIIKRTTETIRCEDGCLTGDPWAKLDDVDPETLAAQFNVLPGNDTAGADVVLINFADSYGPPYRPVGAFSVISVSLFDEHEVDQSCGDALVCFVRLGIDDNIEISEAFEPPPTITPPTITPPTLGPTDPPPVTFPPRSRGSSSCAIAGNPVQLGTALANVLIPLVPVAFAFGVRAVRRRKK